MPAAHLNYKFFWGPLKCGSNAKCFLKPKPPGCERSLGFKSPVRPDDLTQQQTSHPPNRTHKLHKLPTHEANRTTKQGVRYATNREDKVRLSDGGKISFPDWAGAPTRYKERLSFTLKMTRVTCAVRLQRQASLYLRDRQLHQQRSS